MWKLQAQKLKLPYNDAYQRTNITYTQLQIVRQNNLTFSHLKSKTIQPVKNVCKTIVAAPAEIGKGARKGAFACVLALADIVLSPRFAFLKRDGRTDRH